MKKRILAFALAAVLVISSAMSVFAASTYEVTDATWWDGYAGAEVTLSLAQTTAVYTVEILSEVTDWGFEIYDAEERYISSFSYAGSWYYNATGDDLTGVNDVTALSSLPVGIYTVVIVRDNTDFTIVFYDTDATTVLATLGATGTNIDTPAYVHFYAQYGSFYVEGEEAGIDASDITVAVGSSKEADVAVYPQIALAGSTNEVTYEVTSGSEYVEYADGVFTGVAEGTATVTATYTYNEFTYTDTFEVVVTPHNAVTGISSSVSSATIAEGSTITVSPAYSYEDDTKTSSTDTITVTYASSDETVATVNENGVIAAVGAGTATITITVVAAGDADGVEYSNTFTATIALTVTEAQTVEATPTEEATETTTGATTTASTASDTDATNTDGGTVTTTASTTPKTADTTAWGYILLLAGAALAVVVIARKKVTE